MSDKRRKTRIQGGWAAKRNKPASSNKLSNNGTRTEKEVENEDKKGIQAQSTHQFVFKPTIKVSKVFSVRLLYTARV